MSLNITQMITDRLSHNAHYKQYL